MFFFLSSLIAQALGQPSSLFMSALQDADAKMTNLGNLTSLSSNLSSNMGDFSNLNNVVSSSSSSYNYSSRSSKTVVTNNSAVQAQEMVNKRLETLHAMVQDNL